MLQATFHRLVLSAPGELWGAAILLPGDGNRQIKYWNCGC
jgi:hypothetical protein